jgi:hypothetical protein
VRDISDSGARLQFDKPLALSEILDLHIPIKGQTFHAENRWRNGAQIGVAFRAAKKSKPDDTSADRRVDRLKEEITELKKAIKLLRKNDDQNTEAI